MHGDAASAIALRVQMSWSSGSWAVVIGGACTLLPTARRKPLMPMQPPKPTVPTSLPMYFMVSNSAKHGTTCTGDPASLTCPEET